MNFFEIFILSLVEGITEFLPVSSTGHLILTSKLLAIQQTEFLKSFEIAIQLGAILSVLVLYGKSLMLNRKIVARVAAAFVPTAAVGFVLYKLIKKFLLGNAGVVLGALFVGGIFLIVFELFYKKKTPSVERIENISYAQAVIIGLCQALAVVPGVSRSAATIVGGLALGVGRKTIVEFSFLLAVPTMLAATALDLLKTGHEFTSGQFYVLGAGCLISFLVAIAAIKFFLRFIKNHTFVSFGIYRIAVALLFWICLK